LQVGTPQQIYENPASDFVARFIGETNMFTGPVASRSGQITAVEAEGFGRILVEDDVDIVPGVRISVTVRPEKIRISNDRPAESPMLNIVRGVVSEPIYSGFQTKYIVKVEGGTPITVFRQHHNWSEGTPDIEWKDDVYVSWSARDAVIVEKNIR
jgi:spermidine/putrescine transport system ATP-binding protein